MQVGGVKELRFGARVCVHAGCAVPGSVMLKVLFSGKG